MIPEPKTNTSPLIWLIAVPSPLQEILEYLPPENQSSDTPIPGCRVAVTFAGKPRIGLFMSARTSQLQDHSKLRPVIEIIDNGPLMNNTELTLLQWVSDYYLIPPGETFALGLSPGERRGQPPKAPKPNAVIATDLGLQQYRSGELQRAPKKHNAMTLLSTGPVAYEAFGSAGINRSIINELKKNGLAADTIVAKVANKQADSTVRHEPNREQEAAVASINNRLEEFSVHLLHGITGSGKTEVYLNCIDHVLRLGKQVLVLVPEIGLTPQMQARFEARFGDQIASIHSGLGEATRDRLWSDARSGRLKVVVGTRSSVFANFQDLGLIVVDEEHDPAFKQQDHPRYSARDIAVKRAQLTNVPVILGSATPSLETLNNARAGRYKLHTLSARASGATLPSTQIIDIRQLALHAGLAPLSIDRIRSTLARGEQALVFLNRRGFAQAIQCLDCGWVGECDRCDSSLVVHQQPPSLRCHYCDATQAVPRHCPSCGHHRLSVKGLGTEQLEAVLRAKFKDTPVFRVDSDTISNVTVLHNTFDHIREQSSAVLLGTQMLSKGHHFPDVTCVVVVDADGQLFNPDFRAEERLLQILVQVAGRSGRSEKPGEVLIQTRQPEHPLINQALTASYDSLADALLLQRQRLKLPPYGGLGLVRCDSQRFEDGARFLNDLKSKLTPQLSEGVKLVGPMPTLMQRRAGRYRHQIIVQASNRSAVHRMLYLALQIGKSVKSARKVTWFVEIDPNEIT
jgi:primosomal protein N' (replication factor Y)